ncbi:MAG: glutamine--fructose-6-phosphate transaminase (isomerizing) [Bacillota bacterium]|jgi:glucosamine--fructose-6-phosphate aminotransferase (isomerizing)
MCGIVGYIGYKKVVPILLAGLKSLEYRGYDSAGIAIIEGKNLKTIRSTGKIATLEEKIGSDDSPATIGIGHTRWATHGRPCDENSHPHCDCHGNIAMVHNGIIENYLELREWLEKEGHIFRSETDTEVLPHLLEHFYQGDILAAMQQMVQNLRGSYATVAISKDNPDMLVAARKDSPLVIGIGDGEFFFASDIPALIEYTRKIMILKDGEIAVLTREGIIVYQDGQPVEKEIVIIDWDCEAAQKGGYDHFMIKEINEQPSALRQTLKGRISDDFSSVNLPEINITAQQMSSSNKIAIVACGTAYHAGLVAKYVIEKILRLPVEVDIASEFRYRDPLIDEKTLVIVISQSGETADTLAALRESKKRGSHVIAITNVLGSSISREADDVIYTWAGPEIAVASTKAYITQLLAIYLLTFYLAQVLHKIAPAEIKKLIENLYVLPEKVQQILDDLAIPVREIAKAFVGFEDSFYVGRGLDYAVALEGALKLKEISYIHAEAYAAGELKHGTLALIEENIPVIALCTQSDIMEKTVSNIKEIKARDANIISIALEDMQELGKVSDHVLYLPKTLDILAPILSVVPLQMLSYYVALARGCDIDQPRNLAKSVTVE